jgi:hypothetical protein
MLDTTAPVTIVVAVAADPPPSVNTTTGLFAYQLTQAIHAKHPVNTG